MQPSAIKPGSAKIDASFKQTPQQIAPQATVKTSTTKITPQVTPQMKQSAPTGTVKIVERAKADVKIPKSMTNIKIERNDGPDVNLPGLQGMVQPDIGNLRERNIKEIFKRMERPDQLDEMVSDRVPSDFGINQIRDAITRMSIQAKLYKEGVGVVKTTNNVIDTSKITQNQEMIGSIASMTKKGTPIIQKIDWSKYEVEQIKPIFDNEKQSAMQRITIRSKELKNSLTTARGG